MGRPCICCGTDSCGCKCINNFNINDYEYAYIQAGNNFNYDETDTLLHNIYINDVYIGHMRGAHNHFIKWYATSQSIVDEWLNYNIETSKCNKLITSPGIFGELQSGETSGVGNITESYYRDPPPLELGSVEPYREVNILTEEQKQAFNFATFRMGNHNGRRLFSDFFYSYYESTYFPAWIVSNISHNFGIIRMNKKNRQFCILRDVPPVFTSSYYSYSTYRDGFQQYCCNIDKYNQILIEVSGVEDIQYTGEFASAFDPQAIIDYPAQYYYTGSSTSTNGHSVKNGSFLIDLDTPIAYFPELEYFNSQPGCWLSPADSNWVDYGAFQIHKDQGMRINNFLSIFESFQDLQVMLHYDNPYVFEARNSPEPTEIEDVLFNGFGFYNGFRMAPRSNITYKIYGI